MTETCGFLEFRNKISCKIYHLLQMNSLLEEAKQAQLKYRNRIIQLEKQLDFQNLRASQYQQKFKEAVMDNSSKKGDQQLLQKLTEKELQISEMRKQLFQLNKKLTEAGSQHDVHQLMKQNSELRNVVEELKNAAIAAIMEKDAQLEDLKQKLASVDLVQQILTLQEKNQQLELTLSAKAQQYELQIKKITQKLSNQRNGFSQKLTKLQKQISHEQNQKQRILLKAQNLEVNLENMEKIIQKYEEKIIQIQNGRSSDKIDFAKNEYLLEKKIEELQNQIKQIAKNQGHLHESSANLKTIIEEQKKKIQILNQQKQELDRKLKIKNRKNKQNSKSIYQSFEGFSQKADIYSSFAKKQVKDPVKQSFIGVPTKLSDIKEIQIQEIQNFNEYIENFTDLDQKNGSRKNSMQDPKHNVNNSIKSKQEQQSQIIKSKMERIQQLQQQINNLLNQINKSNNTINNTIKELQKQRQDKLQLKQKHATIESQFKVEKESLRLHIFKLQNALLVQKLQSAEKTQSSKQIREYQKKLFQQQIGILKKQIQASKKKKGFFK